MASVQLFSGQRLTRTLTHAIHGTFHLYNNNNNNIYHTYHVLKCIFHILFVFIFILMCKHTVVPSFLIFNISSQVNGVIPPPVVHSLTLTLKNFKNSCFSLLNITTSPLVNSPLQVRSFRRFNLLSAFISGMTVSVCMDVIKVNKSYVEKLTALVPENEPDQTGKSRGFQGHSELSTHYHPHKNTFRRFFNSSVIQTHKPFHTDIKTTSRHRYDNIKI